MSVESGKRMQPMQDQPHTKEDELKASSSGISSPLSSSSSIGTIKYPLKRKGRRQDERDWIARKTNTWIGGGRGATNSDTSEILFPYVSSGGGLYPVSYSCEKYVPESWNVSETDFWYDYEASIALDANAPVLETIKLLESVLL
jgi:hypothetical protein